jgi:hypothetical protein
VVLVGALVATAVVSSCRSVGPEAGDPVPTYAGATLSVPEVIQYAFDGGFRTEQQLVVATAIAIAESGLSTHARNWHPEYGHRPSSSTIGVDGPDQVWSAVGRQLHADRGVWQISSYWWPQYSDVETDDPAEAARIAYEISRGGTDFSPWDTYEDGRAQEHFDQARRGFPAVRPLVQQFLAD